MKKTKFIFVLLFAIFGFISCASKTKIEEPKIPVSFEPLQLQSTTDANFFRIDVNRRLFTKITNSKKQSEKLEGRATLVNSRNIEESNYSPIVMYLGNGLYVDMEFNFYLDPAYITGQENPAAITSKKTKFTNKDDFYSTVVKGHAKDTYLVVAEDGIYTANSKGKKKKLIVAKEDADYVYKEYNSVGKNIRSYTLYKLSDEGYIYECSYKKNKKDKKVTGTNYFILEDGEVSLLRENFAYNSCFIVSVNGNEIDITECSDFPETGTQEFTTRIYKYADGYKILDDAGFGAEIEIAGNSILIKQKKFKGRGKTESATLNILVEQPVVVTEEIPAAEVEQ